MSQYKAQKQKLDELKNDGNKIEYFNKMLQFAIEEDYLNEEDNNLEEEV